MSINITVHGSPIKRSTRNAIILDPEGNRKKVLEERKKLRLEQVRQKSKELASHVRKKVENEKQKQIKIIEQKKQEELKNWKRHLKEQLNNTVPNIGEAHRAAKIDNSQPKIHQLIREESIDLIPATRNAKTTKCREKMKPTCIYDNKENFSNMNFDRQLPRVIEEGSVECSASSNEKPLEPSMKNDIRRESKIKDLKHNYSRAIPMPNHAQLDSISKYRSEEIKHSLFSRSDRPIIGSYASFKENKTKEIPQAFKEIPSVMMSISSSDTSLDSSSSSLETQDIHNKTNQHFTRVYSREKKQPSLSRKLNVYPAATEPIIKSSRTKFTQISDLLNKNQKTHSIHAENNGFSGEIADKNTLAQGNMNLFQEKSNLHSHNKMTLNLRRGKNYFSEQTTNQSSSNTAVTTNTNLTNNFKTVRECQQNDSASIENNTEKPVNMHVVKNKEFSKKAPISLDTAKLSKNVEESETLPSKVHLTKPTSYDYNNRFKKVINPTRITTVVAEKVSQETSATENADIERQLQKSREKELETMRKKTEERGQKALERERIRRDYEMLEAKLDALTKDKQLPKSYTDENMTEVRLKLLENERINKINSSIENVIKRPITITLPDVQNTKPKASQMQENNLYTGINLAYMEDDSGTLNSSDSCCSILLNYVENQTQQINKDIKNCANDEKTRKLKQLLSKLENLKANLMKELEKSEKSTANKNIQTMFDSITDVRHEREKIIVQNSEKKDIEKREKELKKRESILEMKLRQFYEMKKAKNETENSERHMKSNQESKNKKQHEDSMKVQYIPSETSVEFSSKSVDTQDESSTYIEKKFIKVDKPMEIVIKVKEAKQKTPYRKKSSLIQKTKPFIKKPNFQKISTPIKKVDNSEYTSSTVYKSPPETMRTELGEFIDKNEQKQLAKNYNHNKIFEKSKRILTKQTQRTPQPLEQVSEIVSSRIVQNEESNKKNDYKRRVEKKESSVTKRSCDPSLVQYIQRLLGMSRHSIQMLGVSSSDVQTPSSSIINTANNISDLELDNDQQERLNRIQNFIEDNYSFVSEIEKSLKRDEKLAEESEESMRLIEDIWKKSLKHHIKKSKTKSYESPKPILKNKIRKQKTGEIQEKISDQKSDGFSAEERVLEKYTEMTDNCTQRIAELNEMIERVRKEKQKILEITLSSNGGANSETEYLEIIHKSKPQSEAELSEKLKNDETKPQDANKLLDNKQILNIIPSTNSTSETPNKEPDDSVERVQLEKNKLTGVSRDSGISLSRPLTAQDNRESPDIKGKTDETNFEPFLKDIPKPNQFFINKPTLINMASVSITKQLSVDPQSARKNKPPASISRYSPQLVEDVPHELSTILEIDTPATSRLNVTLKDSVVPYVPEKIIEESQPQKQQEITSIASDTIDTFNIDFQKYPNFEEYAKAHNMDIEQFDPEKSAYVKKLYEELFEITQNVDINFKKFPSMASFQNQERSGNTTNTDHDSTLNVSKQIIFKKFLTPKEYFMKIGATDFLDSKSLIDQSQSKISSSQLVTEVDLSSSDKELSKEKELCLKKFPTLKDYLEQDKKSKAGETVNKKIENLSTNEHDKNGKHSNISKSDSYESLPDIMAELKRRNIIKHSFDNKISTAGGSSSSKENKDPKSFLKTKSKHDISGIETISSSHTSSEIGKEFEEMGLEWASLMLKKQRQSKALSSSTSSSFIFQKQNERTSMPIFLKNTTAESRVGKHDDKMFEAENDNTLDTTINEKFSKPLNLREFLTQELQKRTRSNTDSTSLTDDSLASLFLRSLLGSATPSPKNENEIIAGGSSDRQQKTSTPVLLGVSSSSKKSTSLDSNGLKLFSGESRISSVRFNSESSISNDENIDVKSKLKQHDDLKKKPAKKKGLL
ncbi:uncharacterized protein LOC129613043 [Condylostylus longicornis]|uniref:uncharacterized protein LOC129613043 n=1 Tax=Condylostylus longicornis TaxID=2530218 RepID=UPI00244DBF69|nr:uncharacterized protein LOC129613043 [Condylostylus longicornis]